MKQILPIFLSAFMVLSTLTGMAYATDEDDFVPDLQEIEIETKSFEPAEELTGEVPEDETQPELSLDMEEPQDTVTEDIITEAPSAGEESTQPELPLDEEDPLETPPEDAVAEEPLAEEIEPDAFDLDAYGLNQYIATAVDGLTVSGNILINDTVIIPTDMVFTFNEGKIVVDGGCLYIEGCLLITGGRVDVLAGSSLTNEGLLFVSEYGALSIEADAEFVAGESSALVLDQSMAGTASISGIDPTLITLCTTSEEAANYIINADPSSEEQAEQTEEQREDAQADYDMDAAVLNDSIATAGAELLLSGNILINDMVLIPENLIVTVNEGTIVIDGGCLCVEGCLNLTGGRIEGKAGASIVNNAFISVCNTGSISLEPDAEYVAAESSVLLLDKCVAGEEASIEGIAPAQIELCVFTSNAEALMQYLYAREYSAVTITISDMSLVYCLDGELPEGVSIMFKQ